jgi:hypothetical protein
MKYQRQRLTFHRKTINLCVFRVSTPNLLNQLTASLQYDEYHKDSIMDSSNVAIGESSPVKTRLSLMN